MWNGAPLYLRGLLHRLRLYSITVAAMEHLALQDFAHESGAVDLAGISGSPEGVVEVTRNFESEKFGVMGSRFSHIIQSRFRGGAFSFLLLAFRHLAEHVSPFLLPCH